MRRRDFAIGLLLASATGVRAQERAKQHRIAIITPAGPGRCHQRHRNSRHHQPVARAVRATTSTIPIVWIGGDAVAITMANEAPTIPSPPGARLSGESVTTGCSKICRGSVALTTRPFTPLPPLAGGRGVG